MTKSRKEYMLERYYKRRDYAYTKLGGKCVICDATTDLNLDHIIKEEKAFAISRLWSYSQEKFDAELDKCQILCKTCHKAKNLFELNRTAAVRVHGTLSSYRYCKCSKCRAAYSDYWQEYSKDNKKATKPSKKIPGVTKNLS